MTMTVLALTEQNCTPQDQNQNEDQGMAYGQ
jgi:hypothetical protein